MTRLGKHWKLSSPKKTRRAQYTLCHDDLLMAIVIALTRLLSQFMYDPFVSSFHAARILYHGRVS